LQSILQDPIFPDLLHITFDSPLSGPEEATLDSIVANFVPHLPGDYVIIESTLADNQAIQILASNVAGGILMQAGSGGIAVS